MRRGILSTIVVATVTIALATSCGTQTSPGGPSPSPTSTSSSTPPTSTPSASSTPDSSAVALVGSWLVTDAQGAEEGTVLRLAEDLSLWQSCGYLMGSWKTSDHLIVGHIDAGDGTCMANGDPTPPWLTSVAAYQVEADGVTLLGSDGQPVAHLSPGGRPTAGSNLLPALADPPVVTDAMRSALAPSPPLPTSLVPATRADLLGTWVPLTPKPSSQAGSPDWRPHITLLPDGTYTGSDGCNGSGGRWVGGERGSLAVTSGASTLIGCDNVDVTGWFTSALRAGFDGNVLVLVGRDGTETGRVRRG